MTKRNRKTLTQQRLDAQRDHIRTAIERAGSQQALGDRLGVSQAAVSKWLVRGWVPLARAAEIEATFGVPRTDIANPRIVEMLASTESML